MTLVSLGYNKFSKVIVSNKKEKVPALNKDRDRHRIKKKYESN